jgi:uncharacterized oligopeptide transporter (OPT) family protein
MKKILFVLFVMWLMVIPAAAAEVAPEAESTVSTVSAYIKEYVPELLSAGTLVISVAITYLFKKGLLPVVKKVLTSTESTLSAYNTKTEEIVTKLTEKLDLSEKFNAELLERFTVQEAEFTKTMTVVEKVLEAQSDSLFNLLENTNLPADVKALVATEHKAQIEEIRGLLNSHEE